jgi:uncharacterized protein with NRDE domain
MNRDEKRARATALSPAIVNLETAHAIFPPERAGGTWIAANNAGVCLALINCHRINREPRGEIVSRGEVVRALAGRVSGSEIAKTVLDVTAAQDASVPINRDRSRGASG